MTDDPTVPPLGDGGMDRPFTEFPEVPTTAYQKDAVACGGLSVAAAHLDVGGVERPALIFHFQQADGQALLPTPVLVMSDEQMLALGRLLGQGAQRAVSAARRVRRGK